MNRRTYLGLAAVGVAGSIAGCTEATDGREYPPYPDSNTTELSGERVETSDVFEVSLDGPTLIELEHEGSENFTVVLDVPSGENTDNGGNETVEHGGNETADNGGNITADSDESDLDIEVEEGEEIDPIETVAAAVGPYNGRTLHSVDPGSYVLHVLEADAEWNATVYDLPAYDDGEGVELPIDSEGEQYDVIGPIDFGEESTVDFEFGASGEGLHRAFLTDRTGTESLTVAEIEGEGSESVSQDISGVGYLEVLTVFSWSLHIS